jgi:hypothetical protein
MVEVEGRQRGLRGTVCSHWLLMLSMHCYWNPTICDLQPNLGTRLAKVLNFTVLGLLLFAEKSHASDKGIKFS